MRNNTVCLVAGILLAAASAVAQPSGLTIDTGTPEGQLLQQIGTEEDEAAKLKLLEQFSGQFASHEAIGWVLAQMPPLYAKQSQPEKALAACEQLLAKSPGDAVGMHACLKIAEEQKDPGLVRTWALHTHAAAKTTVSAPKPKFEYEDEEQEWKANVEFAEQVGQYAEWSLYNAALQAAEPARKIALYEALKTANPESKHIPQLASQALLAYRQAGQADKAVEMVEQSVAAGTADEDMLLVAADYYLNQKNSPKALEYATKLVEYLEPMQSKEGVDPAAWEAKRKSSLGTGYWMIGVTQGAQNNHAAADQALRKALPLIGDNPQLLSGALFYLGLANYQMGAKASDTKLLIAARDYFKRCAGMNSPFKVQAEKNLSAIETQYRFR